MLIISVFTDFEKEQIDLNQFVAVFFPSKLKFGIMSPKLSSCFLAALLLQCW